MLKGGEIFELEKITTTFGRHTSFKGTLNYSKALKIDGKFEGEINSSGFLYIEKDAEIKADIKVKSVIVGGTVKGNIIATEKCEMLSTGKIYGNIRTARLRIADGVIFEGKCEMIRDPESVDIFAATGKKLKSTVQSV